MTNLTDAIQLIRQGRKEDARLLLESILKIDPKNVQAWFWYVETFPTLEKRIQILNVCLKVNPGNVQVMQALNTLQARQPAPPPSTDFFSSGYSSPPRVDPFTTDWQAELEPEPDSAADPGNRPVFSTRETETNYYDPSTEFETGYRYDLDTAPPEGADSSYFSTPSAGSKPAFDWDALEQETAQKKADLAKAVSLSLPEPDPYTQPEQQKPRPRGRSYPFYQVWLAALLPIDTGVYSDMLDDPEAGIGRAIEWLALTGVIGGVITPILVFTSPLFGQISSDPEFRALTSANNFTTNMIIQFVVMAVLTPVMQILSLVIRAAVLNFVAIMFGGRGNFKRTVYAMSAYTAPLYMITILLVTIPLMWMESMNMFVWVIPLLLALYTMFLDVHGLMAAHEYSAWDAIKTLMAPGIIAFILGCLLNLVVGLTSLAF